LGHSPTEIGNNQEKRGKDLKGFNTFDILNNMIKREPGS
jgi:hypothetical protein